MITPIIEPSSKEKDTTIPKDAANLPFSKELTNPLAYAHNIFPYPYGVYGEVPPSDVIKQQYEESPTAGKDKHDGYINPQLTVNELGTMITETMVKNLKFPYERAKLAHENSIEDPSVYETDAFEYTDTTISNYFEAINPYGPNDVLGKNAITKRMENLIRRFPEFNLDELPIKDQELINRIGLNWNVMSSKKGSKLIDSAINTQDTREQVRAGEEKPNFRGNSLADSPTLNGDYGFNLLADPPIDNQFPNMGRATRIHNNHQAIVYIQPGILKTKLGMGETNVVTGLANQTKLFTATINNVSDGGALRNFIGGSMNLVDKVRNFFAPAFNMAKFYLLKVTGYNGGTRVRGRPWLWRPAMDVYKAYFDDIALDYAIAMDVYKYEPSIAKRKDIKKAKRVYDESMSSVFQDIAPLQIFDFKSNGLSKEDTDSITEYYSSGVSKDGKTKKVYDPATRTTKEVPIEDLAPSEQDGTYTPVSGGDTPTEDEDTAGVGGDEFDTAENREKLLAKDNDSYVKIDPEDDDIDDLRAMQLEAQRIFGGTNEAFKLQSERSKLIKSMIGKRDTKLEKMATNINSAIVKNQYLPDALRNSDYAANVAEMAIYAFKESDKVIPMDIDPEIPDMDTHSGYNTTNAFSLHRILGMEHFKDISRDKMLHSWLQFTIDRVEPSESFSNSTMEHPMQQQLNQVLSEAKQAAMSSPVSSIMNAFGGAFKGAKNGGGTKGGIMGALTGAGKTVALAAGIDGNQQLQLPEVWDSSQFSQDISLTIRCFSPYGHKLAIFESTLAYMALMVLAAPKQTSGSGHFGQPFMFKMFIRGLMMIDIGIVTSLNVTRATAPGYITINNQTRLITCAISVKNLLPALYISVGSGIFEKLKSRNTNMADYLEALPGYDLDDVTNIAERWKRRTKFIEAKFKNWALNPDANVLDRTFRPSRVIMWARQVANGAMLKNLKNGILERIPLGYMYLNYGREGGQTKDIVKLPN